MSRVRVMDLDNRAIGEFSAIVTRGYALSGSSQLQGGMSTSIAIPTSAATKDLLGFGRMIYIEDENDLVPPWAGIIDPTWSGVLPASVTAYSAEYILSLRSADEKVVFNGTFESVLRRLVDLVNLNEDVFLRMGTMGRMPRGQQQLTVDQTSLWDQVNKFGKREGVEFFIRPTYAEKEPLYLYLDAGVNIGIDTGEILHDGERHNIFVSSATVNGKIINRVIGIGKESTAGSRLRTIPMSDANSIAKYRMRSAVKQFSSLTIQSSLNAATAEFLSQSKSPFLTLSIEIDRPDYFPICRPGNWFDAHLANVYLPNGMKGWRGKMRMPQMVYDENKRVIAATLSAYLDN